MEYALSLSYGKDSMACLGAIEQLNLPLDRIVHAEIWATETIPADLPPMVEFKEYADRIIKARYGITVEHVRANVTYEDVFYSKIQSGNNKGLIYGFPCVTKSWCVSKLKLAALKKCKSEVDYIGIAADETKRYKTLNDSKISPLIKIGWTEKDCFKWCTENGLLSPIYSTATRGGCWFCQNQSVEQIRMLRHNYPNLWEIMLKWDNASPISFKIGHTLHDYEKRFAAEDNGLILPNDKRFRWKQLDNIVIP